jgi:poly(3-hydroxybutyrate) depolymerase
MKSTSILVILLLGTSSLLSAALTSTTTTLTSSPNPSTYGEAVTFTAVVAPMPPDGETITFMQGNNPLGTGTLSGGTATCTTSALSPRTYTIKAVYPGDGTYAGSTSNVLKQSVDKTATTTTLVSSPNPSGTGQSVTFTATVAPDVTGTPAPTGNVSFYNGGAKLGMAALSGGTANFTTAKLQAGTESITAVYPGSSLFTGGTSNAVSQTVNPGTFIDSSMVYNGITRYYEIYLPGGLAAIPAMVLMLHGTQSTPFTGSDPTPIITLNWGWQPLADQNGFILVKPASTYDPTTQKWNWNAYCMDGVPDCSPFGSNGGAFPYAEGCGSDDSECPDDSGFIRQLIVTLTAQYNVNPNQVYVAGFSSGGEMTERVGFEISDLVAAISPASGQLVAEQGIVPPSMMPLPPYPLDSIAVQEWHGTEDTNLWPCNYGTTKYNAVVFTLDTVDDTFNFWQTAPVNSCTSLLTTQPLCLNGAPNNANDAPMLGIPGLTGNDATGCSNNAEVQFIWEPGVGHSWQQQYNAQRWSFFAAHPKQNDAVKGKAGSGLLPKDAMQPEYRSK